MRGETRQATVRVSRQATVTSYFDARARVPTIRLRGRWLLRAGFCKGDPIQIKVEAGRLVLARPADSSHQHPP